MNPALLKIFGFSENDFSDMKNSFDDFRTTAPLLKDQILGALTKINVIEERLEKIEMYLESNQQLIAALFEENKKGAKND